MSNILAVAGKGLTVNACGRLVDISAENSRSVPLLRRELGLQLNVCNPASLQLADTLGHPIQTDQDLASAVQDGKHPIQAKLTTAALHEIEQKKLEGKSKEHNLLSLQWQIVIEQVASFSHDLASVAGQLQTVKNECHRAVRQFEDTEALRSEKLFAAIRDEVNERKVGQSHVLGKVDSVMAMMLAEQSAREVADFQLSKQTEQVASEFHADRNTRAKENAEVERSISALKHESEMQWQKNTDNWGQNVEIIQKMDQRLEEHSAAHLEKQQRLTLLEAEHEKFRNSVAHFDTQLVKHHTDMHTQLSRHGEELDRAMRDGQINHGKNMSQIAKENELTLQNLGQCIQRLRDEQTKAHMDFSERSKLIELRCVALEKDHIDRHETENAKSRVVNDKVQGAVTTLDAFQNEHNATNAALRTVTAKVDDLIERMKSAEVGLDHRVSNEHWRVQLEGISQVIRKQDAKLVVLERELNARVMQEGNHREIVKAQIQDSLKACLDKIHPKEGEEDSRKFQRTPEPALRSLTPQRIRYEPVTTWSANVLADGGVLPCAWQPQTSSHCAQTVTCRSQTPTPCIVYSQNSVAPLSPTVSISSKREVHASNCSSNLVLLPNGNGTSSRMP